MKAVIMVAVIFTFLFIVNLADGQTALRGEVAITFDDGPNPKTTQKIVDILKQFQASATFFVVGENVKRYPSLVTMIADSGSEIGNHTWSHPRCPHLSLGAFKGEVETTSREVEKVTGNFPKLFRFPYGGETKKEQLIIRSEGMIPILWDIDPRDWENPSPDEIVNYVTSRVHTGSIVLLHEGKENTIKALPCILSCLEKLGLIPVTLSRLLCDKKHLVKQ